MLALRRQFTRTLTFCGLPCYYSKGSKFEPRTKELAQIIVPWRVKRREKQTPFFRFIEPFTRTNDILKFIQTPLDFRPEKRASWFKKKRYLRDVELQAFCEERQGAVGDQISVGHAILPLGAALHYKGKPWIKNTSPEDVLPEVFEDGWILEAIDISGCSIYYEGFENFRNLNHVHTLIAKKCPYLDDWCLDAICCELLCLEHLDLSGCECLTPKSLSAVARLSKLKTLNVSDIPVFNTSDGQLFCLSLLDVNPNLEIQGVTFPELTFDGMQASLKDEVLH